MAADAQELIALADNEQTSEAGARMAVMDRRLVEANSQIDSMQDWAAAAQRATSPRRTPSRNLRRFELLAAALVLAMVAASTAYGVMFTRRHAQHHRRDRPRPPRGRVRQPLEERVPGQHEPRNPHADERHHRA